MPPPASSAPDRVPLPEDHAWLRWLPFLVLLLAAVLVLLLWDRFPERWPVHWGLHGKPDRWAHKTPFSAFSILGFGVFLCGVIEGITVFLLAHPQMGKNPRVAPEAARAIAGLTAEFLRVNSLATAVVCAGLTLVLPLWQPMRSGRIVLSIFSIVSIAIVFGMWRMRQGARALQARGLFAGLEGWNGIIYRNPQDPRIWVPKITGPGATLNFAHRGAWLWMLVILAVPLLVVVWILVLSMRG